MIETPINNIPVENFNLENATTKPELNNEKIEKIVKQIEYYFGDINLPRDKFLLKEIQENSGWIPVETMLKFNRLAQITNDVNEIANALENSHLIEISKDKNMIRRSIEHPLPDNTLEYWLQIKRRTVYMKGFPQNCTMDELLNFMHQHGNIENLLMRKTKLKGKDRQFKGSIFVTFKTNEEAENFANSDQEIIYNHNGESVKLEKMMQEAYWTKKQKETKIKKEEAKKIKQAKQKLVAQDQKDALVSVTFVKGIVLKVSGFPENCPVLEIKTFFNQYGNVAFVKEIPNSNEFYVRFNSTEENAAQTIWKNALEKENGNVVFEKNSEKHNISGKVIEDEEEKEYWVDFNKDKMRVASNRCDNRGNKRNDKNRRGGNRNQGNRGSDIKKVENDINYEKELIDEQNENEVRKRPFEEEASFVKASEIANSNKKPKRIVFDE